MEEQLPDIESGSLRKPYISTILHALQDAQDVAVDMRDEELAQNSELRRAITIVEYFLRKTKRLCYGGMAINAHLPTKLKFYDFRKTIPDYDFFSTTPEKDCEQLVQLLEKGKFENVSQRFGIHDGTYKIYVNYHGVADITAMVPWLYNKLQKKSIHYDDIHYIDANFLRMSMYLELSRPRGEVERWDKVYKRLLLLNHVNPVGLHCKKGSSPLVTIQPDIYRKLLEYVIESKFIFCGADLANIYEKQKNKSSVMLKTNYPMVLYVKNCQYHLGKLRQIIMNADASAHIKIIHWEKTKDTVPEMYGIKINNNMSLLLLEEEYCFGYNTISVPKYGKLQIASLDTAIALYYTLSYLRNLDEIVPNSIQCFAYDLVKISMKTRDKGAPSSFPPFIVNCQGHQPSKESLLKAKAIRIAKFKKTRKATKSLRRTMKVRTKA